MSPTDYKIPSFKIKPRVRERHSVKKVTLPKTAGASKPGHAAATAANNDNSITMMHDNSLGGWSSGHTPGPNIS